MSAFEERLLTPTEFAARLRVSTRTVIRWIHQGRIKAISLPGGKGYRLPESELLAVSTLGRLWGDTQE